MFFLSKHSKFAWMAAVGVVAAGAVGCTEDEPNNSADSGVQRDGMVETRTAYYRVVQDSPNASAIDVLVSGSTTPVTTNLAFGATTDYASVESGARTFDIRASGETDSLAMLTTTLEAGSYNTIFVYGANDAALTARVLVDSETPPTSGNFSARFVNTIEGATSADVYSIAANGDETLVFDNVAYGMASSEVELASGTYTMGADVNNDAEMDIVFNLPPVPQGLTLNIFAAGSATSEESMRLVAQLPSGAGAPIVVSAAATQLRVVQLGTTASTSVDVLVNGAANAGFTRLTSDEASDYVRVTPGEYELDLAASGELISVLALEGATIRAGESWTLAIGGIATTSTLTSVVLEDEVANIAASKVRVRFTHLAQTVGDIDIYDTTATATALSSDLAFRASGSSVDLAPGTYIFGIDTNNDATADLSFEVTLAATLAGHVANLFVVAESDASVHMTLLDATGQVTTLDAE